MKPTINLPRRNFLKNVAFASAAVATLPLFNVRAQSGAGRKFKIGLIGCGGRGNGAVENILAAAKVMGERGSLTLAAKEFAARHRK